MKCSKEGKKKSEIRSLSSSSSDSVTSVTAR